MEFPSLRLLLLASVCAGTLSSTVRVHSQELPERESAFTESSEELSNLTSELEASRTLVPEARFDPFGSIMEPWNNGWNWVDDRLGLHMGFAYTALYQAATNGNYKNGRDGGVGDLDIFGTWHVLYPKRKTGILTAGTLGFNLEYRHLLSGLPPSELADSIGSLWGTTSGFDLQDISLIQLWWQQKLFDNKLGFRFGKIDLASVFDVYRFNSSNHFFQNAAFSDNPTIPFPENGFGVVGRWDPTEDLFVYYGFGDAEGRKTSTLNTGQVEAWFSAATIGWNGEIGGLGKGLYQVTGWHADRRSNSEKPTASGFSIVAQQELGNGIVPFARYSWSSAAAVDVKDLITAGAVIEGVGRFEKDRLGAAVAWGSPHDDSHRDQWSAEVFLRHEVTPEFRVTPHVQLIIDPSKNRNDDIIGIVGIRGRVTF